MRKTKCKSCNGTGRPGILLQCSDCQGTGEISVYTIQELREGKVAVSWDYTNYAAIPDIKQVMKIAFPNSASPSGVNRFYFCESGSGWVGRDNTNLPTQSVKIFLEEIEQENMDVKYEMPAHVQEDIIREQSEPSFKCGEEVEASDYEGSKHWTQELLYGCKNPKGGYVVFGLTGPLTYKYVRKASANHSHPITNSREV